ncbi:hypothetical protein E4U43_006334 [Claviceps pusilla]|uniref:Nephrocystin 3-like N-terminal domain-containing protein n=1 Tax=Claviceps pusilla TaxID=123648 RepID=A0A9P7NE14_9HYPO|nr:hypothetical protein E4U43_006334 [Claviceps pusilla]
MTDRKITPFLPSGTSQDAHLLPGPKSVAPTVKNTQDPDGCEELSSLTDVRKDQNILQRTTGEIEEDTGSMLYDGEIYRSLGSDQTRRQREKHAYLQQLQADQACDFLLSDSKFMTWVRATGPQELALVGAMGCGKTMAMAFLVDELIRQNQMRQAKVCYHYCQDDETGEVVCIFSTLILSLLEQLPGLKKTFHEWYQQTTAPGTVTPTANLRELEEFFGIALQSLDCPLFIVLDGLDECDCTSQRLVLEVMGRLMQKSPRLRIIYSTRPAEPILEQLDGVPQIILHSTTERDRLIVDKAVEDRLSHLSQDVRGLVKTTLSGLAQGSSIWTKMTVELIEARGITALGPMRTFLDNIPQSHPGKLSELYMKLLSKYSSNCNGDQKLAISALEILAVSRRPLSILELAWAVALNTAPESITTTAGLAELVDHSRVLTVILPFIAYVDFSDLRKHQVRLVHQSVKEFVLDGFSTHLSTSSGLNAAEAEVPIPGRRAAVLEARLLDICIRYLSLEEIGSEELFTPEQAAILELPKEVDLFGELEGAAEYDPHCTWEVWEKNTIPYDLSDRCFGELFVYASCYWTEHLGTTSPHDLPELKRIEHICHAGSTRLRNWTMQNSRPQCTIEPRFPFDASLYDPLSIVSLYGTPAVLQYMIETSDLEGDSFLPRPAMGAAEQVLRWGDPSRVRILFQSHQTGPQLCNLNFFRLVVNVWSPRDHRRQEWYEVFDLIDDVQHLLIGEGWGCELYRMAVNMFCKPMLRRLMKKASTSPKLFEECMRANLEDSLTDPMSWTVYVDAVMRMQEEPNSEEEQSDR